MLETGTLDLITVGFAVAILLGGFIMMFTDYFTSKK